MYMVNLLVVLFTIVAVIYLFPSCTIIDLSAAFFKLVHILFKVPWTNS
jgi:hypothetical protein